MKRRFQTQAHEPSGSANTDDISRVGGSILAGIVLVAATWALPSCSQGESQNSDPERSADPTESGPTLERGDPVDLSIVQIPGLQGLEHGDVEVTYWGSVTVGTGGEEDDYSGFINDDAAEDDEEFERSDLTESEEDLAHLHSFLVYDLQGRHVYKVKFLGDEFPDGLEGLGSLGTEGREANIAQGQDPDLDEDESFVPKTWSDGRDTRIRRGISDGWADTSPTYSRFGRLWGDGSCSATFVGYRLLITAAHCIISRDRNHTNWVDPDSSIAKSLTFGARVDQSNISPTWGTEDPIWYWVPSGYGDCDSENNCNRWDIGLIFIAQPSGRHPGWYGTWTGPESTLDSASKWMRGYPGCSSSGDTGKSRPGGQSQSSHTCTTATLYGDTENCTTGGHRNGHKEYKIDCDGSPGMSGASIYSKNISSSGWRVVGVYNQYRCVGPDCSTRWANRMGAVTSDIVSLVELVNDEYPAPW